MKITYRDIKVKVINITSKEIFDHFLIDVGSRIWDERQKTTCSVMPTLTEIRAPVTPLIYLIHPTQEGLEQLIRNFDLHQLFDQPTVSEIFGIDPLEIVITDHLGRRFTIKDVQK